MDRHTSEFIEQMTRDTNPMFQHEVTNLWHSFDYAANNGEDVIQVLKRNKGLRRFVIFVLSLTLLIHILN